MLYLGEAMQEEELSFDKFMDDILVKETKRQPTLVEETPQQKYMKKYTERAVNRVKYVKRT
jgi:hypothetical protein